MNGSQRCAKAVRNACVTCLRDILLRSTAHNVTVCVALPFAQPLTTPYQATLTVASVTHSDAQSSLKRILTGDISQRKRNESVLYDDPAWMRGNRLDDLSHVPVDSHGTLDGLVRVPISSYAVHVRLSTYDHINYHAWHLLRTL